MLLFLCSNHTEDTLLFCGFGRSQLIKLMCTSIFSLISRLKINYGMRQEDCYSMAAILGCQAPGTSSDSRKCEELL